MAEPVLRAAQHGTEACRPGPQGRVVIVDRAWDRYPEFVAAAAAGRLELHFCSDGRAALRLARRFQADAWLVSDNLPDMDGLDLVPLLAEQICQLQVDPLVRCSRRPAAGEPRIGRGRVFFVAPHYAADMEEQSLASGSAGYLVHPLAIDLLASIVPLEPPVAGRRPGAAESSPRAALLPAAAATSRPARSS